MEGGVRHRKPNQVGWEDNRTPRLRGEQGGPKVGRHALGEHPTFSCKVACQLQGGQNLCLKDKAIMAYPSTANPPMIARLAVLGPSFLNWKM